jgi:hypothetical protein
MTLLLNFGVVAVDISRSVILMNRTILAVLIALSILPAQGADPLPIPLRVFVRGNVRAPQWMHWSSELTVISVIGNAGGSMGSPDVILYRGEERFRLRLKDLIHGKKPDPKLRPGDIVEVLDSF